MTPRLPLRTSHTAHFLYRTMKNNSPLYIASALYAQCAVVLAPQVARRHSIKQACRAGDAQRQRLLVLTCAHSLSMLGL